MLVSTMRLTPPLPCIAARLAFVLTNRWRRCGESSMKRRGVEASAGEMREMSMRMVDQPLDPRFHGVLIGDEIGPMAEPLRCATCGEPASPTGCEGVAALTCDDCGDPLCNECAESCDDCACVLCGDCICEWKNGDPLCDGCWDDRDNGD